MLTQLDRLFWVGLSQAWTGWRHALVFVQPDTVVATGTVSQILGPTIETEGSSSRKTGRCQRNLQTDPADGHR
jgi:hypothetical protein